MFKISTPANFCLTFTHYYTTLFLIWIIKITTRFSLTWTPRIRALRQCQSFKYIFSHVTAFTGYSVACSYCSVYFLGIMVSWVSWLMAYNLTTVPPTAHQKKSSLVSWLVASACCVGDGRARDGGLVPSYFSTLWQSQYLRLVCENASTLCAVTKWYSFR